MLLLCSGRYYYTTGLPAALGVFVEIQPHSCHHYLFSQTVVVEPACQPMHNPVTHRHHIVLYINRDFDFIQLDSLRVYQLMKSYGKFSPIK